VNVLILVAAIWK